MNKILNSLKKEKEISDKMSEKEYKMLKVEFSEFEQQNRKKIKFTYWFCGTISVLPVSIMFAKDGLIQDRYLNVFFSLMFGSMFGVIIGMVMGTVLSFACMMQENQIRRILYEYEAENLQDDVQEDVFENSIKMSSKYLNEYYAQTREQAHNGFIVTFIVSIVGVGLIVIGIVALFFEKTKPSYVTCASGVMTEFIATIFFYLYNKTIVSMSKYHNKLVLSHNISIALRVADTLPDDDKTKSKNLIISELLKDVNNHLIYSDSEKD